MERVYIGDITHASTEAAPQIGVYYFCFQNESGVWHCVCSLLSPKFWKNFDSSECWIEADFMW